MWMEQLFISITASRHLKSSISGGIIKSQSILKYDIADIGNSDGRIS
jgi:hypothetical protein